MKWIDAGNERYKYVWDGDERIAVTSGAIRRLIMQIKNYYTCPFCNKPNVSKFEGMSCEDCLHSEAYKKQIKETKSVPNIKTYKDAVAFGHDTKTGQPLAIDSKGKKFSPNDTIYAKKQNDPNGWKATGKRVKDENYGKHN